MPEHEPPPERTPRPLHTRTRCRQGGPRRRLWQSSSAATRRLYPARVGFGPRRLAVARVRLTGPGACGRAWGTRHAAEHLVGPSNTVTTFGSMPRMRRRYTAQHRAQLREAATLPSPSMGKAHGEDLRERVVGAIEAGMSTGGGRNGFERAGIQISMYGRGRWMDNVFIERLWRSLKHEDVYLKGYADGRELHEGLTDWIAFYNNRRPHQALRHRTPMAVWRNGATARAVDMMDNARALPTCPQPQQQQQTEGRCRRHRRIRKGLFRRLCARWRRGGRGERQAHR